MRTPVFIYGAGGLGREVLAVLSRHESWIPAGFIDDGDIKGRTVAGLKVIGGDEAVRELASAHVVIAIGSPSIKASIANRLKGRVSFPVIVDPGAAILDSATVSLGEGSIICRGAVLTTNIRVGEHVLLNLNATVGHDVEIGAFTSVMPGVNIAGEVKVGKGVLLGSGCNIRNGISIGDNCQVGMGAVVVRDVSDSVTVVGVPARPLVRGGIR